jgi:hypothetical protein
VEGGDLVADLLEERLEARADAASVDESGQLIEIVPETRELLDHRQSGGRSDDGNTSCEQKMTKVSREIERDSGRGRDGCGLVAREYPHAENLGKAQLGR